MRLSRLTVSGFRSLANINLDFERLTILIGENDVGKSSILDILELTLNSGKPDDRDFTEIGANKFAEIAVTLEFIVDESDNVPIDFIEDGTVALRFVFVPNGVTKYYRVQQARDERLNQDFTKLKRPELEQLIAEYDEGQVGHLPTNENKQQWLFEYAESAEKCLSWKVVNRQWPFDIPRFERYRAMDYQQPENIVMKTLKQVYERVIFEPPSADTGERPLVRGLQDISRETDEAIQDELTELRRLSDAITIGYPQFNSMHISTLLARCDPDNS